MVLPIYFINLESRADRRRFMERQFSSLGLQAIRLEATRSQDIPADLVARYCDSPYGRPMTPATLACNFSHVRTWRQFLASDAAAAVVFEDDALLSNSLPAFLDAWQPDPAVDIVRLETIGEARSRVRMLPADSHVADIELCRTLIRDVGCAGYIISRRCAARLVESPKMMTELADAVLFDPFSRPGSRLAVRQTVPALCIQLCWTDGSAEEARTDLPAVSDKGWRRRTSVALGEVAHELRVGISRVAQMRMAGISYRPIPFRAD